MQLQGVQLVEHTLRTILRAVLAIFLSAPAAGLVAGAITEGVSFALTGQFPGTMLTHVLAALFTIVVGYAAALTYAVVESVRGAIRIAQFLESDAFKSTSIIDRAVKGLEHAVARR
jgi:hypothetical protein